MRIQDYIYRAESHLDQAGAKAKSVDEQIKVAQAWQDLAELVRDKIPPSERTDHTDN